MTENSQIFLHLDAKYLTTPQKASAAALLLTQCLAKSNCSAIFMAAVGVCRKSFRGLRTALYMEFAEPMIGTQPSAAGVTSGLDIL